jgi:hypothetical protein
VIRRGAVSVAAALAFLGLAGVASGLPPFTTARKTAASTGSQAELSSVAAGCHAGYDRFVLRARSGGTPGYDVRYVSRIVADGSGNPISLQGSRFLLVVVRNARGHTSGGTNLLAGTLTPHCSNLRQLKKAGDFEGVVSYGLGLRRRTGFRVFRLTAPTRIVVDVAH